LLLLFLLLTVLAL